MMSFSQFAHQCVKTKSPKESYENINVVEHRMVPCAVMFSQCLLVLQPRMKRHFVNTQTGFTKLY